jgi:hypothetical protein
VPHGHWKTTTFVGALRTCGMTAPMVLDGAMHGRAFLAYVEQVLVPTLTPDDIVVMDIRDVERRLEAPDAPTRDHAHDQARRIETTKKDPATLYKELEEQLRRRDQTRGKQKTRDRDGGGRDR